MRRLARAASTLAPQISGSASPRPQARSLAGLADRSRCGVHCSATMSAASAAWSALTTGPSPTWCSSESTTTAAAVGSSVRVGTRTVPRSPIERASVESSGAASRIAQPRRLASATVAPIAADWCSSASLASTTTRSSGPAQPGSPGSGQATSGTGQTGSSTARTSRASAPTTTTPRGVATASAGSWASIASIRMREPAPARWRSWSSWRPSTCGSSSRASSNSGITDGTFRTQDARRAWSTSSTAMPSRTG